MEQRVKEFFLRYERANSSSDISEIGRLYADTFMFGGQNGVQTVKKEDFLKVVPKMKTHFSSMGLSETQLQTVKANPLDSNYLLAKVVWRIEVPEFIWQQASEHIRNLHSGAGARRCTLDRVPNRSSGLGERH
jgi:hypothetical protein